ncbi:MAG: DUF4912 domain-containing protein [Clostridia bacterium]
MPKATKEASKKSEKDLVSKEISKIETSKIQKKSSKKTVAKKTSPVKPAPKNTTKSDKVTASKTSKKAPSKKTSAKTKSSKVTTKAKKTTSKKSTSSKINLLEYYDLPYRYNQTVVKVLAQTPKTLFVYWDISDEDRKNYIKQYGEDFFNTTKPVLIVHNVTMNYTFEIEINDFANCWYFNINDEKCEYVVELGRKPKNNNTSIPNNYLYVTSSNKIESPNGHVLFEKAQRTLYYRDVKTNKTYSKDVANLEFIKYFGRIYNLTSLYKEIYKDENIFDINNPTSSFM